MRQRRELSYEERLDRLLSEDYKPKVDLSLEFMKIVDQKVIGEYPTRASIVQKFEQALGVLNERGELKGSDLAVVIVAAEEAIRHFREHSHGLDPHIAKEIAVAYFSLQIEAEAIRAELATKDFTKLSNASLPPPEQ